MINKILIPINESQDSTSIISYSINIYGSELTYVLLKNFICDYAQGKQDDGSKFETREKQQDFLAERTLSELNEHKSLLKKQFPKAIIECIAVEGSDLQSVYTTVRKNKIDLVVVGATLSKEQTSYSSSLAGRLIGSLESHILVVPFNTEPKPIEKIVIAYSDLELSASMFEPLHFLTTKANVQSTMLYLNQEKDIMKKSQILAKALATFIDIKSFTHEVIHSKHIVEAILDKCGDLKPNLLVMFTKEESYIEDFWTGSEIDEISHFLQQPMLVLWED